MSLQEFRESKLNSGKITFKDMQADIKYSPIGSGHYFTLSRIKGKVKTLLAFLKQWEPRHTFCIITYDEAVRNALIERGYSPDFNGHLRIGVNMEGVIPTPAHLKPDTRMLAPDLKLRVRAYKKAGRPKKLPEAAE